ncbi:hypothetical protein RhiirA4_488335 [Rhizophagus irregularis]|uniref:Uncharacterized protein n=1 Tax=Rhizophagus irregularis TaxID=588596 RepID=A0A2I1HTM9_9GLOM|nr:hypothetical protein RhiirA4_488335 [Rhizophagus irregularis]
MFLSGLDVLFTFQLAYEETVKEINLIINNEKSENKNHLIKILKHDVAKYLKLQHSKESLNSSDY